MQLLDVSLRGPPAHEDARHCRLCGQDARHPKNLPAQPDYSFGHEVSKDARAIIGKARPDVQFVGDEFHPFGKIKDFSPYILKIKQAGADTVLTGNWGNDLALLVRASKEAGLKTKFITYYGGLFGVPTAIGTAGEDTVFQIASWHPNVPVEDKTPQLEKYQRDFKAKFGEDLYYTSILVQMDMLARAIEGGQRRRHRADCQGAGRHGIRLALRQDQDAQGRPLCMRHWSAVQLHRVGEDGCLQCSCLLLRR